jgi:hypothetical protein
MQTLERTESAPVVDEPIHTPKNRNRTFVFLSAILAVAVLVMGAIMIFGDDGGQSLTPEQEQMLETIDQYGAALNAGDGAAATALMAPSGYHDNGKRYPVADGRLEAFFDNIDDLGFSMRRSDAAFIGTYVITTDHIPADSEEVRPSIFRMNADGTMIMWHYAP